MPHREALKETRKKKFFARVVLVSLFGFSVSFFAWQFVNQLIEAQNSRNMFLTEKIRALEAEIVKITTLEAEINALKARQKAVEDLQADRNLPVYVFQELNSFIPEGVVLRTIKQDSKRISISGIAQTQERISEILRNFTNASVWLEKPELVEIKLVNLNLLNPNKPAGEKDKLYEFTIAVFVKREKQEKTVTPPLNGANINSNVTLNNKPVVPGLVSTNNYNNPNLINNRPMGGQTGNSNGVVLTTPLSTISQAPVLITSPNNVNKKP